MVVCVLAAAGVTWLETEPAVMPMAIAKATAVEPIAVSSARGDMVCSFFSFCGGAPLTCLYDRGRTLERAGSDVGVCSGGVGVLETLLREVCEQFRDALRIVDRRHVGVLNLHDAPIGIVRKAFQRRH